MSFNDMKDLYKRSVIYQFIFFFYSVIMVDYTRETPIMMWLSMSMIVFNLWLMGKTLDEYKRKKLLYTDRDE